MDSFHSTVNLHSILNTPRHAHFIAYHLICIVVQVSVDGTSFTSDCTRFQYYRTPELTQVTPDTCRPPFPRLRVDGEHLRPNEDEALLVRFEEEQEEDSTEERGDGGGDEGAPLLEGTGNDITRSALSRSTPRRVFVVPGRVESEVIEVGTDPDTELPIHEERWFLACDSPPLPPEAKLPFVSRVTVAPNGADFDGESLRFIAHDPHADVCLPSAVPAPAPPLPASDAAAAAAAEDDDGDKSSDGGEARGPCVHITGRNLYRGTNVAVRLRFGLDDESVVPFHTVSFDASSESIVGVVPIEAGELVAEAPGAPPPKEAQQRPPAVSVVVEVSVDGVEFFAVPERLTLYRGPQLALHGDGLYPAAEGGLAELKTTAPSFRGHQAKVGGVMKECMRAWGLAFRSEGDVRCRHERTIVERNAPRAHAHNQFQKSTHTPPPHPSLSSHVSLQPLLGACTRYLILMTAVATTRSDWFPMSTA